MKGYRHRGKRQSQTITIRKIKGEVEAGWIEDGYPENYERPTNRGQCVGGMRPCPFVGCRYHLYLDVCDSGSLRINFPTKHVWEMTETCALDIADRGNLILKDVAEKMNITGERVRQIERRLLSLFREHFAGDFPVDMGEEFADGEEYHVCGLSVADSLREAS